MTNDRRMVPGPSDEDLDDFLSDPQFPSLDADDLTETSFEWTVVKLAIRAALARWGAQTEYDAGRVEALVSFIENGMSAYAIEISQSPEWDQELLRRAMDLRSSSRPKGRVVEGVACLDTRGNPTQVTFDIAASKIDEVCRELNPANGRVRFAHACVEILDAPEEG